MMKKLATLLLAAGMVLGGYAGAQAIDFKVKGEWIFEFTYNDGINFARDNRIRNYRNDVAVNPVTGAITGGRGAKGKRHGNGANPAFDNFEATQRIRLQLDAVASESLSGQVFFEIGDHVWGDADRGSGNPSATNTGLPRGAGQGVGGALGADGVSVEVRRAFIDWIVPNTDLRVRMGLQGMALPSYTFETAVFNHDVAAVNLSYKVNDNVSIFAFWARPFNDNAITNTNAGRWNYSTNYMDNADAFGLGIPLTFDGFKITPWAMLSFIGPNTLANAAGDATNSTGQGLTPAFYSTGNYYTWDRGPWDSRGRFTGDPFAPGPYGLTVKRNSEYATAWWVGLTGEITAADPLRIAWDANYGSVSYVDTTYLNRSGWFINLLIEYKLDWGVPGLYGWWGSGDDSNPHNGSERMPIFNISNTNLQLSHFGFNGGYYSDQTDGASLGQTYAGSWGIGARIRDMSFIEDLKHTLRVNLFGGTNDPAMAKYILGKKDTGFRGVPVNALGVMSQSVTDFNSTQGVYLTKKDYGIEVNFDSIYKIYENLDLLVELGYIHLWLDQSSGVWGSGYSAATTLNNPVGISGVSVTDAIKASVFFRYSF
jgi:hypothetical protein